MRGKRASDESEAQKIVRLKFPQVRTGSSSQRSPFTKNSAELRSAGQPGRLPHVYVTVALARLYVASYTPFRFFALCGTTPISRGQGSFPATRWSLIVAARSAQPEERRRALEVLIAAYWKPVYKYIRLRWEKDNEEAKDLTQDFFLPSSGERFSCPLRPAAGPVANFFAGVRGPPDRQ